MYYGDQRESMVNICHTLQDIGWRIFGYNPDRSDSMTDYYDPASWDGVATKNGYVLCVDVSGYRANDSGKEIYKYVQPSVTFKSTAKIEQLQRLANDRAATDGEKIAALAAIERIQESARKATEKAEAEKTLICTWPVFQQNPPHCNWHIEKDNVIVAKGRGAFQFHNLPYWVDHMTGEDNNTRRAWELNEEQKKDLEKFQSFIKKVESFVSVKLGEWDGETFYKTIIVTEYKVENKVQSKDNGVIEAGASFILNSGFNYGCYEGLVYKIERVENGYAYSAKYNGKLNKLCHGRASSNNSFNMSVEKLQQYIDKNAIAFCDIVEVKTPYQVEKCVKVESEKPTATKTAEIENVAVQSQPYTYEIWQDIDTRDGSIIFMVKILEKLDKGEYITASNYMKKLGGYYSKFKKGFLFRADPTEILNGTYTTNSAEQSKESEPAKQNCAALQEKIQKQIDSNNSKIEKLSGNYQTNTYKRMREQNGRDSKVRGYQLDNDILNHLLDRLDDEQPLTKLENALLGGAFRTDIHNKCDCHKRFVSGKSSYDIKYPAINPEWEADNWYNIDVPKQQKRLNNAEITNTKTLIEAVEQYEKILNIACKPIDQTAQKIKKLERECKMMQKGDINFTPTEVARQLVELARIDEGSRVLEPSAGTGAIADCIREVTQNVDVVERMSTFRELLQLKGYNLVGDDFLEYQPTEKYDTIIANPPFSDEQNHIRHAYEMLADGGILVSITSPHWTFASDKKSVEFRNWLDDETYYTQDLASGTFEMTGVSTKILVIEKHKQAKEQSA